LGCFHFFWFNSSELSECCAIALEHNVEVEYVTKLIRLNALRPTERAYVLKDWPWDLRIVALGDFAVWRDGKRLGETGKQKKVLEMLRLLVAYGVAGVPQERLSDLLWPDADGDKAQSSFDTTISRLRQFLGCADAIVRRGGRVALDPQYVYVDAWALAKLLDTASATTGGTSVPPLPMIRLSSRVKELYRGELFGADSVEPYLDAFRDKLHRRVERCLTDV